MRRRTLLASAVAGVLTVIPGCADDDGVLIGSTPSPSPTPTPTPEPTPTPTPTPTSTPTPEPPAKGDVRVRIAHPSGWEGRITYGDIRETITGEGTEFIDLPESPGVVVVVVEKTSDSLRPLTVQLLVGATVVGEESTQEQYGRVRLDARIE